MFSQPNPIYRRTRKSIATHLMLASLIATFTWGCFHLPAPYQPDHWPEAAGPIEALSDSADRPVIQVIIAYNSYWPNHTALRLVNASGETVFWDPAGGYGKTEPHIVRQSDLIMKNAPDLSTYMVYRWGNNDQAVEIFEWELSATEAGRFETILLDGAKRTNYAKDGFRTATPGLFCNAAVSSFLYHHGRPSIRLKDSYILPNLLSRELYLGQPDRVMILKRDLRPMVLVLRPPGTLPTWPAPPETTSSAALPYNLREAPSTWFGPPTGISSTPN